MELNKLENKLILKEGDSEIETYSFDEEINFGKLVTYLMGLNFESKVTLEPCDKTFTDVEKNIYKLISSLIINYNLKVDDYLKFVSEHTVAE